MDHRLGHEHAIPPLPERSGPLTDIRIIDLTAALAGPFCTMLLADLGADVIKVEPPNGDFTRGGGPFTKGDTERNCGGYFASVNRSKRSIVLDLQQEADRETLRDLVRARRRRRRELPCRCARPARHRVRGRWPRSTRDSSTARSGASAIRAPVRAPTPTWPAFDVVAQAMSGLRVDHRRARHVRHACRSEHRRHLSGHAAGAGRSSRRSTRLGARGRASSSTSPCTTPSSRCARRPSTGGATGVVTTNRTATRTRSTSRSECLATADGAVALAAPTNHWPILCEIMGRPRPDRRRAHSRPTASATRTATWSRAWSRAGSRNEPRRRCSKRSAGRFRSGRSTPTRCSSTTRTSGLARCWSRSRRRAPNARPCSPTHRSSSVAPESGANRRPPLLDEHGHEIRAELDGTG